MCTGVWWVNFCWLPHAHPDAFSFSLLSRTGGTKADLKENLVSLPDHSLDFELVTWMGTREPWVLCIASGASSWQPWPPAVP